MIGDKNGDLVGCLYCKYWARDKESAEVESGWCHRRSPLPLYENDFILTVVWPRTFGVDWCGEFERIETVDTSDYAPNELRARTDDD